MEEEIKKTEEEWKKKKIEYYEDKDEMRVRKRDKKKKKIVTLVISLSLISSLLSFPFSLDSYYPPRLPRIIAEFCVRFREILANFL